MQSGRLLCGSHRLVFLPSTLFLRPVGAAAERKRALGLNDEATAGPAWGPSAPFGHQPHGRGPGTATQASLLTVGGCDKACSVPWESDTQTNPPSLQTERPKGLSKAPEPDQSNFLFLTE